MKPTKVLKSPLLTTAEGEGQESPLMKISVRVTGSSLLAAVPTKLAACAGGHGSLPCPACPLCSPQTLEKGPLPGPCLQIVGFTRNVISTYGNRDAIIFIIAVNAA